MVESSLSGFHGGASSSSLQRGRGAVDRQREAGAEVQRRRRGGDAEHRARRQQEVAGGLPKGDAPKRTRPMRRLTAARRPVSTRRARLSSAAV